MQLTASTFDFFTLVSGVAQQVATSKPCKIVGITLSNGQASNDAQFTLSTIAGVGVPALGGVTPASQTIATITVLAGDTVVIPIAYFADKGLQISANQNTCFATVFRCNPGA